MRFTHETDIQREQVEGRTARGVQLTHGQRYVEIDEPSKGSQ